MSGRAGVVLAGGRSSRMGRAKADLPWAGSTLLEHTVQQVARGCSGPVVVVRAEGQALPALPVGTHVHDDEVEGAGPLQGLAVGLAAAAALGAESAFACSTDLPFLHPAYVRRLLDLLDEPPSVELVLPVVHGHRQPLAASYRTALAPTCARLVAEGRLRPGMLLEHARGRLVREAELLAGAELQAADPGLQSVVGVNTPQEYADAVARAR